MLLKLTAAYKTDVGKQREQNEDNAYYMIGKDGDRGLFIVADGMGGYQAGEVASQLAVQKISEVLQSFISPVEEQPTIKRTPVDPDETIKLESMKPEQIFSKEKTRKQAETPLATNMEDQLIAAIQQANKAIIRYGEQQAGARGLGCTVTTALIQGDKAYVANIGDSRTYRLRNGELTPLTKDHSLVARLLEARQIEPEDVYSHPQRNLIYRSLGANRKTVEPDVFHDTLQPGDRLLLCSDGLWEMVRPQELLNALSADDSPEHICNKLINMANASGGEDNITALVVFVSAGNA